MQSGSAKARPAPSIFSLNPKSGPIGTVVTVSGSGFTPTAGFQGSTNGHEDYGGNTVRLGSDVTLKSINSTDGVTLRFEIPQSAAPGLYSLTVVNQNGASNSLKLKVTAPQH